MKKVWRRVKEVFGLLLILAVIMWGLLVYWKDGILYILYEKIPQYSYLDKYILKEEDASLWDLIEFSDGGEGKKRDFLGQRIHFAADCYDGFVQVYVYKGDKTDGDPAQWQTNLPFGLGGYIDLKWWKAEELPQGYVEIDGVITDIRIGEEITPVVYVQEIEKKDFEEIEWQDWQVVTKKSFKTKKEIKPDIEITRGGIKRYFKSIEFSDMGAELTFIPEKLKSVSWDEEPVNGTMGNVVIEYDGKKCRQHPATERVGENEYISKETFFIKGLKPKGTLKLQIPIVGSKKPEHIEISLDDAG